jgi:hypothetical protein
MRRHILLSLSSEAQGKKNQKKTTNKIKKIDNNAKVCFITAYRLYFEVRREAYSGYEVQIAL